MKKSWQEKLEDKITLANAVEEAATQGRKLQISYWRTLKSDGFLNDKYPGGQIAHKKLLEKEGYKIVGRGKKCQVADFEKYLIKV